MKNLMTQKIVFGMLMTLVLALGVQSVVEAVQKPTFTGQTETDIIMLRKIYNTDEVPVPTLALDDPNRVERVTISRSGGIVFTHGHSGKSSVVFEEDGTDGAITPSNVNIRFTSAGRHTVTISGRDYDDTDDTDAGSWSFTYIYYVTQNPTSPTTTVSLTGLNLGSRGYATGYFADSPLQIHRGSGNYPVIYGDPDDNLKIHLSAADTQYLTDGGDGIVDVPTAAVSSAFNVHLAAHDDGSQTITAQVENTQVKTTAVYIYGFPTLKLSGALTKKAADDANALGVKDNPASEGEFLQHALYAYIEDGQDTPATIEGLLVKFTVENPRPAGGILRFPVDNFVRGVLVGSDNQELPEQEASGQTLYVQTKGVADDHNPANLAGVSYTFGSAIKQEITVTALGQTQRVTAYTKSESRFQLIQEDIHSRSDGEYHLFVRVEDVGERVGQGYEVEFFTNKGELITLPRSESDSGTEVKVPTDPTGIAQVIYDPQGNSGDLSVIAWIRADAEEEVPEGNIVDQLIINVRGSSVTPQQPDQQPGTGRYVLTLNLDPIRGAPGDEVTLQATARNPDGRVVQGVEVTFTLSNTNTGSVSPTSRLTNSNGIAQTIVTIPNDDAILTASASGYDSDRVNVDIEAAATDLEVVSGSGQTGTPGSTLSSPFVVRFEDSDGDPISGAVVTFTVESGGGSVSDSTDTTDSDGEAETTLTLGNVSIRNTVRASVSSTDFPGVGSVTFTAEAELPADAIIIDSGDDQIGQVGRRLDEDLSVQVVDRDDNGISGIRVRFRVTEGRGRLSRNSAQTDQNGYAEISFTPTADGESVVEAYATGLDSAFFTIRTGEPPADIVKVSGDNQTGRPGARIANPLVVEVVDENGDPVSGVTVRFAVTAGNGSVSPETATTNNNGRAQTRLTLGDALGDNTVAARVTGITAVNFKASSGAEVLVGASQRPPMYWVSRGDGKLHRLVGEEVENLAPNVEGVTSLAVDTTNNLLYFGVKTNGNRGAIRRANLNGRNPQVVRALSSAPVDIAVANGTLYWLTSGGRIRSITTEGSAQATDVAINLPNPTGIALSPNGFLYWAEPLGRIRRVRLTGTGTQRTPQTVATGLGEVLSVVVGQNKVYWTERGESGGVLQRANFDGTGREQLKTFSGGVPMGLGVDASDNKLYWTRPQGKLQRANLLGKFVKDIATGLMNPGDIALGVEVATSTPGAQNNQQANNQGANDQQQNNQQASDTSKYDVNSDGTVDNLDVTIVALALGTDNLDYDVNGDGSVDANDLRAVIANSDSSGAAPMIDLDLRAMDIDFDRVQEQVEVLLAAGDISLEGQRVLLYLQHLLASARPDETVLLANYPNPFNPETWIPYHLAESTDVRVNIYDTQGVLVRVLPLGHQTAGYYTSRSRAAYWDGRNALGERVASGIYFYQLQTDEMSPLRKMVILK